MMDTQETINIRLSGERIAALSEIAQHREDSYDQVVSQAIVHYLAMHLEWNKGIEDALLKVERGETLTAGELLKFCL